MNWFQSSSAALISGARPKYLSTSNRMMQLMCLFACRINAFRRMHHAAFQCTSFTSVISRLWIVDCIQASQFLPSSPFEEEYQLLRNLVNPNRISFRCQSKFWYKLEATAGRVLGGPLLSGCYYSTSHFDWYKTLSPSCQKAGVKANWPEVGDSRHLSHFLPKLASRERLAPSSLGQHANSCVFANCQLFRLNFMQPKLDSAK